MGLACGAAADVSVAPASTAPAAVKASRRVIWAILIDSLLGKDEVRQRVRHPPGFRSCAVDIYRNADGGDRVTIGCDRLKLKHRPQGGRGGRVATKNQGRQQCSLVMLACAATAYAAPFEVEVSSNVSSRRLRACHVRSIRPPLLPHARKQRARARKAFRGAEGRTHALSSFARARDGKEGSWVRLTEFEGRIEGAIWDGEELYAVDELRRNRRCNDQTPGRERQPDGDLPAGRLGRSATGKFLRPSHPRARAAHAARPIQIAGAGDARAGDRRRGAWRPDRNLADRRRRLRPPHWRWHRTDGFAHVPLQHRRRYFRRAGRRVILASDIRTTSGPGGPFTSAIRAPCSPSCPRTGIHACRASAGSRTS